jgi:ketosteroid isomerase-like protein
MSEVEKIRAVLDCFALGWRKADAAILKGTWDRNFADSIYQASERETPVCGYDAIAKYYDEATSMYPITSMEISNVRIQQHRDVALAYCDIAIGFKVGNSEYLVHPRASFLLKKQGNGEWLTQHYHESIKYEVPKS